MRLAEAVAAGAGERAAADLHDQPVDRLAGGCDLPGERLAALDGEPVEVPLARERQRALCERLLEPLHGGIAGNAGGAGADGDERAQLLEPVQHERVGADRDEDAQRALARGRDDRRGERRVAAARDREVGPFRRAAEPLGDFEIHEHAEQVAGLVRAGDVAGLVLDPDAARSGEAEPVAELVAAAERRHREAVAVDGGDALVEPADERAELRVADSARRGDVVGVEQLPVADERIRLRVAGGEADTRRVERAMEDVVDVAVASRVRAPERKRLTGIGLGVAAGADETADRRRHDPSATPVRALNSSISSSHTVACARVCSQKDGLRRAWKSASEMPCCSTHV